VNEQPAPPPAAGEKTQIDPRKLLVPPKNADGSFMVTPFSEDPVRWMRDKQQNFYRQLSGALKGLQSGSAMASAWTLIILSFLYGVFHAAGPGHGKVVISGWLLATEHELRRGILIAALSALFQALTAIVIVSALVLFVQSASAMARDVAGFLESASYLMIAGLGLYLIWTAVGRQRTPLAVTAGTQPQFEIVNMPQSSRVYDHVHGPDCDCGHAHAPAAADVKGDWSLWRAVTLAFAVGLRPCTGAILMLIFSWSIGLYWAGVMAALVMGLGVFITISIIASLAVYSKALALRYAALDGRMMGFAVTGLRAICGVGIAALGGLMFWASLGSVNTMM
jgi:ABC-type nickel/cobalt efflux system permease component RcnA